MQVQTLTLSRPQAAASSAAPAEPPATPQPDPQDAVSVGSSWKDNALVRGVTNIAKEIAIAGGIPALGAAGGLLGPGAMLAAVGASTAAGAYLGYKNEDISDKACERTLFGASVAAAGATIGAVAASAGGIAGAGAAVGFFAACGAFRGLMGTLAEYNLV